MAYFSKLPHLNELLSLFSREDSWLIAINADPDALASAMALKRIMARRVNCADIANVNKILRPDNLQMIQSLRIKTRPLIPTLTAQYNKFALVDSQPHHHEKFAELNFSVVIDHHPLNDKYPARADYVDIVPQYGANATRMTQYLYNLKLRPGKLLATALQYGIKTDTSSFERSFHTMDLRAFQYLNKYSSTPLLRTIYRSEFRLEWLRYFWQAYLKVRRLGQGLFTFLEDVENPDILVILADFFLRMQGSSWTAVGGVTEEKIIIIFRGDGLRRDMGKFAANCFSDLGSAGGHRNAARAEIDLKEITTKSPYHFVWQRLHRK